MKTAVTRNGYSKPYATDRNGKVICCDICKAPLTYRRISFLSPFDFQRNCFRHDYLKFVFNIPGFLKYQQKHLKKKFGIGIGKPKKRKLK